MAVGPQHRTQEEYDALIRGEMRRRQQSGLPGRGAPRAFMPPVGQPIGLASRPGPGTLAAPPAPQPPTQPVPQAVDNERPPAQRPAAAQSTGTPTKEPGWLETIFGAAAQGAGYYDEAKERYRQEAARDPGSAESAQMRQRMGPMLQQLGLRPDELAALSADDIAAVAGKGDLLAGVMSARQKAAAAKEKAVADAEARRAESAEFDRRARLTGNTAEGKAERARIIAGSQEDRATRMAFLQHQLQTASAAERRQYEAEIAELRRQQALEDDARRRGVEDKRRAEDAVKQGKVPVSDYVLPGWQAADGKRAQQTIYDTERRKEMEKTADADAKIDAALAKMKEIHDRVGTTPFSSDDASDYAIQRSAVMGGLAVLKGTGAIHEADEKRFSEMIPDIKPGFTWLDAQEALGLASKGNVIAGARDGIRRLNEKHLRQFGFSRGSAARAGGAAAPSTPAVGQVVNDADSPEWEDL